LLDTIVTVAVPSLLPFSQSMNGCVSFSTAADCSVPSKAKRRQVHLLFASHTFFRTGKSRMSVGSTPVTGPTLILPPSR
jgi:hypothetical protein